MSWLEITNFRLDPPPGEGIVLFANATMGNPDSPDSIAARLTTAAQRAEATAVFAHRSGVDEWRVGALLRKGHISVVVLKTLVVMA